MGTWNMEHWNIFSTHLEISRMLSHWEITKYTDSIAFVEFSFFPLCREKSHAVVQMLFLSDFFLLFLISIISWFYVCNNGFFQQWNRNRFNSLLFWMPFFYSFPPNHIIKMLKEPWRHGCGGQSRVGMANSISFVYALDWIPSCELFHKIIFFLPSIHWKQTLVNKMPLLTPQRYIESKRWQNVETETRIRRKLKKTITKMIRKYGQITK